MFEFLYIIFAVVVEGVIEHPLVALCITVVCIAEVAFLAAIDR